MEPSVLELDELNNNFYGAWLNAYEDGSLLQKGGFQAVIYVLRVVILLKGSGLENFLIGRHSVIESTEKVSNLEPS